MGQFFIFAIFAALLGGCAAQPENPFQYSGFLSTQYYDRLTKVESPGDKIIFRYIKPDFKAANYHHFLIDPVIAYPEPKETENISIETMISLQAKLTILLENGFSNVLPIARTPGEGVLRFQTAITGVNVSDKDLEPYEYIPFALIAAGVNTAAGGRDQEVKLFLEGRFVDSVTNEVHAVGIRRISVEDLANVKARLQADQLNEGLNTAANDMVKALKGVFSN